MGNSSTLVEPPAAQQLAEQATLNREAFRAQAMQLLSDFTPADRELATGLATPALSTADVLERWRLELWPLRDALDKKKSSVTFERTLARNLQLAEATAHKKALGLIAEREKSALDEFIAHLYPKNGSKDQAGTQRKHAIRLFSRPDEMIDLFYRRYHDFTSHLRVAKQQLIAVCDPHASWVERQKCALQVRKERHQTTEQEDERLAEIKQRLAELRLNHDGLLGEMVNYEWDFVRIMDLRNQYEKRLEELPAKEQKSPAKRLKIFDDITHRFRDAETEKQASKLPSAGLKDIRHISDEIDHLLLRLFDLGQTEKNRLMLAMKEFRELNQEHDMIHLIRKNRLSFHRSDKPA